MLTGNRNVHVHGVTQRLALVEFLHPHRRSVPEGIDGVVVSHRDIAEHNSPEADVPLCHGCCRPSRDAAPTTAPAP